jgi:Icc-related predicted phosphoesterase
MRVLFVSDLHGDQSKYIKLSQVMTEALPDTVLIGGDILPNYFRMEPAEFVESFLKPLLSDLKQQLKEKYPKIFYIFGNDDPASALEYFRNEISTELMKYINLTSVNINGCVISGYGYVPPTPFLLKDWEKYDVSRFVPRDAVSPEEGIRTVEVPMNMIRYSNISEDLENLQKNTGVMTNCICLFHAPPYETTLDKIKNADINGNVRIVGVGSIAVRRFIEKYRPKITLHGHIHESAMISGSWKDRIGNTYCFSAAHNGPELAIVSFDSENPENAERLLL